MKSKVLNLLLALSLAFAGACGGEKKEAHGHDHDHENGEEHSHAEGEGHEDEDGGHVHGEVRNELGEQSADGWTVTAAQMDEVKAGGETVFYLGIKGAAAFTVGRMWVGDEAATNSVKAMIEVEEEVGPHAHVEVPDPFNDTDKFYVELDNASGTPTKLAFEIKR